MSTGRRLIFFVAAFLAASRAVVLLPETRAADSLSQLRSDVRAPDPPQQPERNERDDDDSDDDWDDDDCDGCDDDGDDSWLLAALRYVGTSPFWGPQLMIGDGFKHPGYFPEFPYQYERGYMMVDYVDLY